MEYCTLACWKSNHCELVLWIPLLNRGQELNGISTYKYEITCIKSFALNGFVPLTHDVGNELVQLPY